MRPRPRKGFFIHHYPTFWWIHFDFMIKLLKFLCLTFFDHICFLCFKHPLTGRFFDDRPPPPAACSARRRRRPRSKSLWGTKRTELCVGATAVRTAAFFGWLVLVGFRIEENGSDFCIFWLANLELPNKNRSLGFWFVFFLFCSVLRPSSKG